jgi:anaerobic selenocysteine-containing dehydrogenase
MSWANSRRVQEALRKLAFSASVERYLTPTAQEADLILPASTCWEGWTVRSGFFGGQTASCHLQYRSAVIEPLYDSRPDLAIIFQLAGALNLAGHFWNGDLEKAFAYFLEPSGITLEELRRAPRGITYPAALRYWNYKSEGFQTPSRRIELYSTTFQEHGYPALPVYEEPLANPDPEKYPLTLITKRRVEYTHGRNREVPGLRKRAPDPLVYIHPDVAREKGITQDEWVYVETNRGRVRFKASLTDLTRREVVFAEFGWWQECRELGLPGYDPFSEEGSNINLIVDDDQRDPVSATVPVGYYPCDISKISGTTAEEG